jgi:hypothetical protein
MVNKYMKKCLVSLDNWKMQILIKMTTIKKPKATNAGKDAGKRHPYTPLHRWECKLKTDLPYNLAIPCLRVYPKESKLA